MNARILKNGHSNLLLKYLNEVEPMQQGKAKENKGKYKKISKVQTGPKVFN